MRLPSSHKWNCHFFSTSWPGVFRWNFETSSSTAGIRASTEFLQQDHKATKLVPQLGASSLSLLSPPRRLQWCLSFWTTGGSSDSHHITMATQSLSESSPVPYQLLITNHKHSTWWHVNIHLTLFSAGLRLWTRVPKWTSSVRVDKV